MKIATLACVVVGLLLGNFTRAIAELRVGTVDFTKVHAGYWRTKEVERELKELDAAQKREFDLRNAKCAQLEWEVKDLAEALKEPDLAREKSEAMQRAWEKKRTDLQDLQNELKAFFNPQDETMSSRKRRLQRGLIEEVTQVVKKCAVSEGYDFVFDSSSLGITGKPILIQVKDGHDFTQVVLEKLNADRPKEEANLPKAARVERCRVLDLELHAIGHDLKYADPSRSAAIANAWAKKFKEMQALEKDL